MKITEFTRWMGPITALAGFLYAAAALIHPSGENLAAVGEPRWLPAHLIYWIAIILLQAGLTGLYLHQAERAGRLGLAGFVMAFVGTALAGSIVLVSGTLIPQIVAGAPAMFDQVTTLPDYLMLLFVLGYGAGYVLFGVATMRAGVLPRGSGVLMIAGVLLFFTAEMGRFEAEITHAWITAGDISFGLSLMWMGRALWSKRPTDLVARTAAEVAVD